MSIQERATQAKQAQIRCASLSTAAKNTALEAIAAALLEHRHKIESANQSDITRAEQQQLEAPLLKRLKFQGEKIDQACQGVRGVAGQSDPVGVVLSGRELDEGLRLFQVTCPIGVIGMIFESRPDALVQMAALSLKSGNAVLLKGGREALETNRVLAEIIAAATEAAGIPAGWIQLIETREDVKTLLGLDRHIDLLIPRGSNQFVRYIMDNTNIPVLGHADGVTHLYVHSRADIPMAVELADDSKNQYVAVCNALETLLVDASVAGDFLPPLKERMDARGTELRGCERTRAYIEVKPAQPEDWSAEYLDKILAVKIVDGLDAAIEHINTYGSGHTDAIVTADQQAAEQFMNLVDSADVFWNASTRFSDGFRFGLGAEVGISTNKIHARGPVGLEGLVIYKWRLYGSGQKAADYSGPNARTFLHRSLNLEEPGEENG
ncbi:MAG: glutamate-5-semialdehyde dehydrogenase [Spirochaetia bacterium]|nr:glutamate-5-semialdehyde dehydrogenase [Spirochaetia bacterium]